MNFKDSSKALQNAMFMHNLQWQLVARGLTPHYIPGHVCLLMYFINKAPTCHVYLWHFFGWENRSVICIIFRLCVVSYLVSTTGNLLPGIQCRVLQCVFILTRVTSKGIKTSSIIRFLHTVLGHWIYLWFYPATNCAPVTWTMSLNWLYIWHMEQRY